MFFRSLLLFFLILNSSVFGQYAVKDIPKNLKNGVSAVVRNQESIITLDAYNSMTYQYKKAVTVFNRNGDNVANTSVRYDNERSFKILEVKVFDGNGEEIKKFKKRDFIDVSASGNNLYTDDRVLYVEYTPRSYPYTLEFVFEYKTSSTAFMPAWNPVQNYEVATQKSSYTLHNPHQVPLAVKKYNFENFNISVTETPLMYQYKIKNLKPFKQEVFSPYYTEFVPRVKIALQKFQLVNQSANVKNWEEFGRWQRDKLLKGRGKLSEATKARISKVVVGVEDPKEKARLIYEYMQSKTRYISIQAGIGGWQPTPAAEVDELSYGDCKGLTNYTMALLESQGIESYYTLIYAGPENAPVDKDFVASQFNHAILTVPFEDETVFLECTSQEKPFGYMGSFTDNRNVLMVTPSGGVLTKTTSYKTEDNIRELKANVVIDADFNISGALSQVSKGVPYEEKFKLNQIKNDDLELYYKQLWGHLANLSTSNRNFDNNKRSVAFTEILNFETTNYASTAGDRILVNPNIFNRYNEVFQIEKDRTLPLVLQRGVTYKDQIEILLPEGYTVEAVFEPIEIKSKFGSYKASVQDKNLSSIIYKRELILNSGTFPKEEFNKYVKFIQLLVKKDKSKIVLSKK
ncbi:MAG: hypothetical protein CMC70_09960 [Flavobacteriaceae bacterium]|nr:hypothetical protein [Flavobacteriaceae bacterium]